MDNVCNGGTCAALCPLLNLGGNCPSVVQAFRRWQAEQHEFIAAVTGTIAIVASVIPPDALVN